MALRTGLQQKQTGGMAPEHLIGKSVLKMGLQELQEFVQAELNENPALELKEEGICPVCGTSLIGGFCATCGSKVLNESEQKDSADDWDDDTWQLDVGPISTDSEIEPFSAVATPCSLADHLKEQISGQFDPDDVEVAEFIVDCLDEDGYLREPLFDLANRFGLSVPQFESVLVQVQNLDPPGIAARSLQECLLIQLRQIDDDSDDRQHAGSIVREHWEIMSKMKIDEIARRMKIDRDSVASALRFIRERLNPYPASMFRDPWQILAPRGEAKTAPDIIIRETEADLVAEVVDPISSRIAVDEIYASLYAEITRKRSALSDIDKERVRESVQSARSLIDGLEFRKSSIRKIAEELLKCQVEFFMKGPEALKPLMKKELAQMVGLHESTICRATDGKTIQLPSGEVIPLETLFDSALPVKELVRKLASERNNGKPLSDNEIAERLKSLGIQIARRTVAKYRDQLRLPSIEYRLAG